MIRRIFAAAFALAVAGLATCHTADAAPLPIRAPARHIAPAAQSRFAGKFELVPLFVSGHKPVLKNGHQDYANRNTISFRSDAGDVVTVFAGETTDLASIPRIVWPILPPDGPWAEAAVIHDACFRTAGTFDWRPVINHHAVGQLMHGRTRGPPYDYHGCNELLREAMVYLGVPTWKRVVIFEAVEIFGRPAFGT